jgi:hypothetical protein
MVGGTPFPIPKTGLEVIWNHMVRYMGIRGDVTYRSFYVSSAGKAIMSSTTEAFWEFPMYNPEMYGKSDIWGLLRVNYMAPARRAGEIILVHEPGSDYTAGKGRSAWQYLVGQRRVRRAPAIAFDTPQTSVAGTSTYDDTYMYNGSPERYTWKLLGKEEKIVPSNANELVFDATAEELLGPKFIKPEFVRYEKRRVWIVEANLKEGSRHIYSKRRYYLDEDTWTVVAAEVYDGRGELWRVHYGYPVNLYDQGGSYSLTYGTYDLVEGIYNLSVKTIPGKFNFSLKSKYKGAKYYTSQGMARGGVR